MRSALVIGLLFLTQTLWANDRLRASHEHFAGKSWGDPAVIAVGVAVLVLVSLIVVVMLHGKRKRH